MEFLVLPAADPHTHTHWYVLNQLKSFVFNKLYKQLIGWHIKFYGIHENSPAWQSINVPTATCLFPYLWHHHSCNLQITTCFRFTVISELNCTMCQTYMCYRAVLAYVRCVDAQTLQAYSPICPGRDPREQVHLAHMLGALWLLGLLCAHWIGLNLSCTFSSIKQG